MSDRWLSLFLLTRALAIGVAAALLLGHRVTDHDLELLAITLAWGIGSAVLAATRSGFGRSPGFWAADAAIALALTAATGDWRSPFYLLGLTSLILPATALRPRLGALWGAGYATAYLATAVATGLDRNTLETTSRLETLATHVAVPLLVAVALAYAQALLLRLEHEQARSERLAIESERKRIAWELHDSAKQRVGAAHLVLTAIEPQAPQELQAGLHQALTELRRATADMDTSLTELRTPLVEGRHLARALGERAHELEAASPARIAVSGQAGALPPFVAAHAYRIASEALANAVRHAEASEIAVSIERSPQRLRIIVRDDGRGLGEGTRVGANGLRSMRSRAETIGAQLLIGAGDAGGTEIELDVPLGAGGGEP